MTERFNDEDLFNQYKEGDAIPLILIEKFDKKGKVIERILELPE